jgi:imidazolonepropionase-like amidohydrolase
MARANCTFRQRDVTAAVKAARAAGVEVARIEVDKDGKIVVIAGKPLEQPGKQTNEWDEVYGDGQTEIRK